MDHPFPAGSKWGGLNRRSDPTELSPEQSPDTLNSFFYDKKMGLLGPRLGKTYAGADTYNIWGVMPYNISGQLGHLIAYGDSTSTEIDFKNIYNFTIPHGGWGDAGKSAPAAQIPAAITRIVGELIEVTITDTQTLGAGLSSTPIEVVKTVTIPAGCKTLVCSNLDAEGETSITVTIDANLNAGGWTEIAKYTVAKDCSKADRLNTNASDYINIDGNTSITAFRVTMTNNGSGSELCQVGTDVNSGTFTVMLCGVAAAGVIAFP